MNPEPPTASPSLSVRDFMIDKVLRRGHRALLVTEADRLIGLMSVTDAKEVPTDAWDGTPISQVMTSAPLKTVSPAAVLSDALKLLVDGSLHQPAVVDDGHIVGLLGRAEVLRFIQLRDELGFTFGPRRRS